MLCSSRTAVSGLALAVHTFDLHTLCRVLLLLTGAAECRPAAEEQPEGAVRGAL
jgi:hypothetical protein